MLTGLPLAVPQDCRCIVYEYCAGGDLTTFLEELKAGTRSLSVELCHAFALRLLQVWAFSSRC